MKIKKKLTRKQFLAQEDEFIVFVRDTVKWVKEHGQLIIFGIIGIGIITSAIYGIRYKQKIDRRNCAKLLLESYQSLNGTVEGEAAHQESLQSGKKFKDKEEKYTETIQIVNQLLESYPGSSAAEDALFLKAEAHYNLGQYDEAVSLYNQYLDTYKPKGTYSAQALVSIGYVYEEKGEYQKAIDLFQEVVDNYPDYLLHDTVFMELARCYEQVKAWDKAKEAYQKVVMNYSDSPMLSEAQRKLEARGLPHEAEDTQAIEADSNTTMGTNGGAVPQE
jgi:tetratricopeptide (TPR) repeat protein